jgi:hypothetical protein
VGAKPPSKLDEASRALASKPTLTSSHTINLPANPALGEHNNVLLETFRQIAQAWLPSASMQRASTRQVPADTPNLFRTVLPDATVLAALPTDDPAVAALFQQASA